MSLVTTHPTNNMLVYFILLLVAYCLVLTFQHIYDLALLSARTGTCDMCCVFQLAFGCCSHQKEKAGQLRKKIMVVVFVFGLGTDISIRGLVVSYLLVIGL